MGDLFKLRESSIHLGVKVPHGELGCPRRCNTVWTPTSLGVFGQNLTCTPGAVIILPLGYPAHWRLVSTEHRSESWTGAPSGSLGLEAGLQFNLCRVLVKCLIFEPAATSGEETAAL